MQTDVYESSFFSSGLVFCEDITEKKQPSGVIHVSFFQFLPHRNPFYEEPYQKTFQVNPKALRTIIRSFIHFSLLLIHCG